MIFAAAVVLLLAGLLLAAGPLLPAGARPLAAPLTAAAQEIPPGRPTAARGDLRRAEVAYFDGEPERALAALERLLEGDPDRYEALWRASWTSLSLGLMEDTREGRIRRFEEGASYGRRAEELRPHSPVARYWHVANLGLRALEVPSLREMARRGEEVFRRARSLIADDSLHAGAHNVMGRTQFEVMKVSGITRFFGGLFIGGELLDGSSWEGARFHLERAVELDPDLVYYRVDLARLHAHRERSSLARRHACRALALPTVYPPDPKLKAEARAILEGLGGDPSCEEAQGDTKSREGLRGRLPGV